MLDGRLLCLALSALAPAHALLARSMALRRTEAARCRLLPPRVQLFNATFLAAPSRRFASPMTLRWLNTASHVELVWHPELFWLQVSE